MSEMILTSIDADTAKILLGIAVISPVIVGMMGRLAIEVIVTWLRR